jgi:quercetin dioxygenase-like cupin family protein
MKGRIAVIAAVIWIGIAPAGAIAETLSPTTEFEGRTTTPAKDGATQPVRVVVQSWEIAGGEGPNGAAHEIPLQGFYLAHLLSGHISATIDGQTAERATGDYWTVKAGATMQVKVRGEFAVLETVVVSKQ